MRKLWKTLIFLIIIAGASAAVYAISRNSKKGNEGPKLVDVTTGSIVEKAVAVGQIDRLAVCSPCIFGENPVVSQHASARLFRQ